VVTVFSLLNAAVSPTLSAQVMTRADYEACQTQDEDAFRKAIEAITIKALDHGLRNFDYRAAVAEEWRKGGLDAIIDGRVDIAVGEVRDETSWGSLIQSLASREKAQELAVAVAERVYRSDAVEAAIESLVVNVSGSVGAAIELASRDAAEPAITCLQAFLGPRFGSTISRVVARDAGHEFDIDPSKRTAEITSADILKQSGGGITGAALLIVRRQLANMGRRIGQRVVGSILSRLVSVVAGGVGLVLIAKDIWDLRHGVLPIIAEEMKSKASKETVQSELAKSIAEQIGEHVKEIGARAAERVVEVWHEFRAAHAKALEIAEKDEHFKRFLNGLKAERLARLDEIVSLLLAAEGEAGILKRLQDGMLDQAVNHLPSPAMEIARETRSLKSALEWSGLAGSRLEEVVELGLYRRAEPASFSGATLARVLGLGDRLAIVRLASIQREARDTLFDLDDTDLKVLARSLAEAELETLARYLTGLGQGPRERVLRAVAKDPSKMQVLASERVRDAVLRSRDQSAAVDMMLRADGILAPLSAYEDMRIAFEGQISPLLVWEKHPAAVIVLALVILILLATLYRLFRPRRRTDAARASTPARPTADA